MLTINFQPFPNLESERLSFREINENDILEVMELRGNADTMKFIPRPLITNEEEALAHITMVLDKRNENDAINWVITEKNDNSLIGIIGFFRTQHENFRSELGYMILPQHNGKGYMTEAVATVLDFGFQTLNFHSVNAIIDPNNIASSRVLEKNGFRKEAHFKEDFFWNDKFIDSAHYGLLKKEFSI
jgi:ribosomal-protein-alanine N-acetyltransferase